jgi:L-asparaginase
MMQKRILLVSLGGTITMTAAGGAGLMPTLGADDLLRRSPDLRQIAVIESWSAATLPSASLTIDLIVGLARELRERFAAGFDGAVVVQGTDTLEETAFLLDCLVAEPQPIVVTGAMRAGELPGADGMANLSDAIRVAADDASRGRGTLVAFGGEIHAARFALKTHTVSLTSFQSRDRGPIGIVCEEQVRFHSSVERMRPISPVDTSGERPVALLRFALGDGDRLLKQLPGLGFAGLVIEAAGGGHVSADQMPALRDLAAIMPVIRASRCHKGPVLEATYAYAGSEIDLRAAGVLSAGDLCGLKARLLLALLLMTRADRTSVEAEFRLRAVSIPTSLSRNEMTP